MIYVVLGAIVAAHTLSIPAPIGDDQAMLSRQHNWVWSKFENWRLFEQNHPISVQEGDDRSFEADNSKLTFHVEELNTAAFGGRVFLLCAQPIDHAVQTLLDLDAMSYKREQESFLLACAAENSFLDLLECLTEFS